MGKSKTHKNGRSKSPTGRFARLPHEVLLSPAYRSLTPNARSLLVEFMAMDTGQNNGSLWLSVRDGAARIGLSNKDSAASAFAELEGAGLLRKTKDAHFSVKASETSRARCWRLTFIYAIGVGRTDEWKQFIPADKRAAKRVELGCTVDKAYRRSLAQEKLPVLDLRTTKAAEADLKAKAVHELRTDNAQIDAKPPKSVVLDYGPYTAVTIPTGSQTLFWRQGGRLSGLPDILISQRVISAPADRLAA